MIFVAIPSIATKYVAILPEDSCQITQPFFTEKDSKIHLIFDMIAPHEN